MVVRNIVRIDEELCDGCGACVTPCAEGAIELRDGVARVVSDELCDGAGFCLAVCPTGALSVEAREARPFDEHAAREQAAQSAQAAGAHADPAPASDAGQGSAPPAIRCFRCEAGEDVAVLMPCRWRGESLWVCTRCLPALIHG